MVSKIASPNPTFKAIECILRNLNKNEDEWYG